MDGLTAVCHLKSIRVHRARSCGTSRSFTTILSTVRYAHNHRANLTSREECNVSQIVTLFTEDYSGWEADGDPVDLARQKAALDFFCAPKTPGVKLGFSGTTFKIIEMLQVGKEVLYLRVNIANDRFVAGSFNFSESLFLERKNRRAPYQIRLQVQCTLFLCSLPFLY